MADKEMAQRMKRLADDFDKYEQLISNDAMRKEMQAAVVFEMQIELDRLRHYCNDDLPRQGIL